MKTSVLLAIVCALTLGIARADEPAVQPAKPEPTKATFLITGLHCPPCTNTIENSLQKSKGLQSIKVDWDTKAAAVEFDESLLPAATLEQLIANTPHKMGSSMHYDGWLQLQVPDLKDDSAGK